MKRQKVIILPQLNDCKGDLLGNWFIYYSCRNPKTGRMERLRVYNGFSGIPTAAGRHKHAEKLIADLTNRLKAGWTPFQEDNLVIYDDHVMYENIAKNFGRKQKGIRSVRTLVSQFLSSNKNLWAPKTHGTYVSKLRILTQWCESQHLVKKDVSVLTQPVMKDFFDFLLARDLSERTIEKYKQVLTRLFDYLLDQKQIHESPLTGIIARGKVVDQAPKPILKDDLELLKAAIMVQDPQLWLACQFQYYCFIRPGTELRLLKVQDINLQGKIITITSERAKNRTTEIVQIPNQFQVELTTKYKLQDIPKDFFVFGRHGYPGPEPMGKNTFRVRFNHIRDALKLSKEYKFYSWKHTGATAAVDAGIPERHLMNQLRHKSFESTDHYFRRHVGYRSPAIQDDFPDI